MLSGKDFKIGMRVLGVKNVDDDFPTIGVKGTVIDNVNSITVQFDTDVNGWNDENDNNDCLYCDYDDIVPIDENSQIKIGDRVIGLINESDSCMYTKNQIGTVVDLYDSGIGCTIQFDDPVVDGWGAICVNMEFDDVVKVYTADTSPKDTLSNGTACNEPETLEFKKGDFVRMKGQDHIYRVVDVAPNRAILLSDKADYYRVFDYQIELVAWFE